MLAQQGFHSFPDNRSLKKSQFFLRKSRHARLTRAEAFLLITSLRDTVWDIANHHELSRLARFYLVGLIDALRFRIDQTERRSCQVRYPASTASAQLDMGDASITRARQELVAAGLIAIDKTSAMVDLSGYIAATDAIIPDEMVEREELEVAFSENNRVHQDEQGGINLRTPIYIDTYTPDINVKDKDTCTKESNVFFYENINDLKESILLSKPITKALSEKGVEVSNVNSKAELLSVVEPIAQKLLSERDVSARDCGNIWKRAVQRHGLGAINGLIVALHDPSVLKPVGWFVAFANGGGDFSRGDLTPNLARIQAAKQYAAKAQECSRIVEASDARRSAAKEVARKVLGAVDSLKNDNSSINSKSYSTFIAFVSVKIEENGQVRFSLDGRQDHDHYQDWKKIITNVCSFVGVRDYIISGGVVLNAIRVKDAKPLN